MATSCNLIETVLCFFCNVKERNDLDYTKLDFSKLKQFKYIYILYFLADIVHYLVMLSKVFQNKYVDVTIISCIVRTKIIQIKMLFIVEQFI